MRPTSHGHLVYVIVTVDDDHSWMYQTNDDFRNRSTTHLLASGYTFVYMMVV